MKTRSGEQLMSRLRIKATTVTSSTSTSAVPLTSISIVPPYIADISHPVLVKEHQEYEDAIEARCAATGEDKSKALRSVKNSFNRNLLNTLCKFEWGTTIEDATEDHIRSELDSIIRNVMNDDIVDVGALFT
ncbi:LOW QUALITY PROTEIN: Hypothetical protein PHPALM_413 [Phytophthora palmivora]|uniref:Uncharacterized protein n=1 Tax=Phytophthora palmivora TaxID=4796 RepID=A0A2P4YUX2_9STRA|nr:LOW QUALITY PROTEIN: Hypothetical protein PHPALM_413 [Phytophthora palmivora]